MWWGDGQQQGMGGGGVGIRVRVWWRSSKGWAAVVVGLGLGLGFVVDWWCEEDGAAARWAVQQGRVPDSQPKHTSILDSLSFGFDTN